MARFAASMPDHSVDLGPRRAADRPRPTAPVPRRHFDPVRCPSGTASGGSPTSCSSPKRPGGHNSVVSLAYLIMAPTADGPGLPDHLGGRAAPSARTALGVTWGIRVRGRVVWLGARERALRFLPGRAPGACLVCRIELDAGADAAVGLSRLLDAQPRSDVGAQRQGRTARVEPR